MKKLHLILILIIWLSCDKIEPPYIQNNDIAPQKTILVEKFTGHKCSNCPEASRKIDELKNFYGDAIIPISIHPGNLPEFTDTDNNYPYDFTTSYGDTIANDMGATFLPLGTINRIPGGISNRCWTKDQWSSQINNLLFDENGLPIEKKINIELTTFFNETNKELTVETNIILLSELTGNYNLCLLIIEDEIIAPQVDGSEYIINYEHNHIYRCAINNVYGQSINEFMFVDLEGQAGYQSINTVILNESTNINWNEEWDNLENCHVIAYIYNTESLIIEESIIKHITYE